MGWDCVLYYLELIAVSLGQGGLKNLATLQDLRKRKFKTIKAFSQACGYGYGPQKASAILRGLYHMTLSKDEIKYLASILGVNFVECADACDNTFAELKGYKGDDWKRTPRTRKGIWVRWQWEEDLYRDTKKAAESGDWKEYRNKYANPSTGEKQQSWQKQSTQTHPIDCFSILGISSNASAEQIKDAFRQKVKASSDGKGGYIGDMHKLVLAKEKALNYAQGRR